MIEYLKAKSAARRAKRTYELAVIEGLMAENRLRMERLADLKECRWCAAVEGSEQREVCETSGA